jgi:mucin-19
MIVAICRRARVLGRLGLAIVLPALLAAGVAGVTQPARAAATITVGSCDESDLDTAIAQANADNAGDTIAFGCSGTIGLTSTLAITGSMTLDGTGQQVTLSGQGQVGVLSVASGVTLTLNDLTVTGGSSADGGGLDNDGGTVNITGSTFTGNDASAGGAILNQGGTLNVTGSTISGNDAHDGAGVQNLDATANITDSTFDENVLNGGTGTALNNPSGSTASITGSLVIDNLVQTGEGGAVTNDGTLSIASTAFSANTGGGLLTAGAATVTNSSFQLDNGGDIDTVGSPQLNIAFSSVEGSLKAPSSGHIVGSIVQGDCAGTPIDGGYNMESGTSCGFTDTGDLQNTESDFGSEPNFSLTLPQGSPAIDAVPLALCPATDENGNPRPDDPSETTCDMGATESDYPPVPAIVFSSADPSTLGQPVTFTATFTPTDGGGSVAFYADGSATPIPGCGTQALIQATGTTYRATCTTSSLPLGTDAISATYSGDSAYPAITGNLADGQRVQAPLTSVLTSSANPSAYGQPVTFTATVTPSDGSGEVTFYQVPLGAQGPAGPPISGCIAQPLTLLSGTDYTATCTTAALPAADDESISAIYVGDGEESLTLNAGQTVDPAPLTADVAGSQTYGGTPVFTVTGYTGLVNADTPAVVSGTLTGCTTTVGPGAWVGSYTGTISGCSGLSAANYTITYGDAGLAVTPAPLTANVAGAQTYGGSPVFTVTGYTGLVNGDTPAVVSGTLAGCTTTAGPGANPGTYTGTISGCSGLSSPNYALSYADGGVTVGPAPLTITASSGTMTYGGTPPTITPSYSGFVNGDTASSLTTAPNCSTTATSTSSVGTYPSTCAGAADPNYAISYVAGTLTVTQAGTTLTYTGPQTISTGTALVPSATLASPSSACQASQTISFSLNTNPVTGAAGPYTLESAVTNASGTATGASVSTNGWQAGAYTLTAAYAGTGNCAMSTATSPLAVTTPGLTAAGAGTYPVTGAGMLKFGFIVALIPHTTRYAGAISLVSSGWWLTGSLSSYAKTSSTQGTAAGTGSLYWWNQALKHGRGGWQLANTGVAFTVTFAATTKTSPGAFGIQISYAPTSPQPTPLPNSALTTLKSGTIIIA